MFEWSKSNDHWSWSLNIVNDLSNVNYDVTNEIADNTEVLKSNLFGYNDGYILVKEDITATADRATQVAF